MRCKQRLLSAYVTETLGNNTQLKETQTTLFYWLQTNQCWNQQTEIIKGYFLFERQSISFIISTCTGRKNNMC